ncbi:MAG: 2-oxo acid dehydrogenase subunit E2 [Actinobacteria bacterium]|nr:2-oxo acid dehydrogenase subunit E2 [Actinomycetota bacterium]
MANVTLPQLGETVTEGTITKWFKRVGDAVAADEPLFEVSTDKVDTEVPSPVAGVLTEIKANEGDTVPVGAVIAVVGDVGAPPAPAPAAAPSSAPAPEPASAPTPAPAAIPTAAPPAAPAPTPAPSVGGAPLLSPVVRRLIAENNLDAAVIKGTGPAGRITREDVLAVIDAQRGRVAATPAPAPAVASTAAAPASAKPAPKKEVGTVSEDGREKRIKLSKIRKLTGEHMVMSKSVSPHTFSVVEVDYANVDRARGKVKDEFKQAEGFSLTYLPFISRAVIDAITEFPHMNASVDGNELVVHNYVDLGIAVDLDYQGLLVPVVRDAETKRLRALAREISDLGARAKNRKLTPDEIQGGTFTLSNNGSAGSVLTMAVINQPQVAIISTDAIVRKPVVVNTPENGESIAVHPVGNLAMSWDHRAFDGAYAANFLSRIKSILETRDWIAEF